MRMVITLQGQAAWRAWWRSTGSGCPRWRGLARPRGRLRAIRCPAIHHGRARTLRCVHSCRVTGGVWAARPWRCCGRRRRHRATSTPTTRVWSSRSAADPLTWCSLAMPRVTCSGRCSLRARCERSRSSRSRITAARTVSRPTVLRDGRRTRRSSAWVRATTSVIRLRRPSHCSTRVACACIGPT